MNGQQGAPTVLDTRATTRLRDKATVVTGAGQGIGRATARRFAQEGALVVVADLHEAGARRTVDELREFGADAVPFVGDVGTSAGASALVATCIDAFGRVDVLVNNVGGATTLKPFVEWTEDEIVAEVNRSLWPTVWCCRAVLPHMIERRSGRIVNVGAESVRNGLWDRAPYNVAKGGVHALTTSIAREVAELGITCNCVAPAATATQRDRLVERPGQPESDDEAARVAVLYDRMIGTIPLGRPAEAEEQAAAIAFLASDDASFVTGQVLSVNGGSSMV